MQSNRPGANSLLTGSRTRRSVVIGLDHVCGFIRSSKQKRDRWFPVDPSWLGFGCWSPDLSAKSRFDGPAEVVFAGFYSAARGAAITVTVERPRFVPKLTRPTASANNV